MALCALEQPVFDHLWTWIQVGKFRADFGLAMDRLSGIYALFVTFVGFLIHIFAIGYMHGDKGFYRFFAYLNLFMFSMLTLMLADNFLLMFVGWEGVGLCSYLLIGYYFDQQGSRRRGEESLHHESRRRLGIRARHHADLLPDLAGGHASISFFDKADASA